jgi:hypothetical protein
MECRSSPRPLGSPVDWPAETISIDSVLPQSPAAENSY